MSLAKNALINLDSAHQYFSRSTRMLGESHSGFSPAPGMMTARELALHLIGCHEWLRMAAVHGDGNFAHFKVSLEFEDGVGAAAHPLQSYRRQRLELTAPTQAAPRRWPTAVAAALVVFNALNTPFNA